MRSWRAGRRYRCIRASSATRPALHPEEEQVRSSGRPWEERHSRPSKRAGSEQRGCPLLPGRGRAALFRLGVADDDLGDRRRIVRTILGVARRGHDLVRYVHPLRHLTEHRVLLIEEAGIGHDDEELRGGAVRVLGAGHRDDAAGVVDAVELLPPTLARRARTPARGVARYGVRVAALDHEAGEYAGELGAVVEALLGQVDEVVHVFGRHVGKKTDVVFAGSGPTRGTLVLAGALHLRLFARGARR